MALKFLPIGKKVDFPTRRATTKNVTKLGWWWWDSILKNMTNQGDCTGDIVVLDVALNCVKSGVLYFGSLHS